MYWNWCMILLCQLSFKWYPLGEDQNNFWTVYGGQRSKKGNLGKISHFLCDFLLLKQQNWHKNWCILLLFQPSVMYGPLTKIPNNLWDGMQRSKVKRNHFWWSLPFFIVILVYLVPEYTKELVLIILFYPLANPGKKSSGKISLPQGYSLEKMW